MEEGAQGGKEGRKGTQIDGGSAFWTNGYFLFWRMT